MQKHLNATIAKGTFWPDKQGDHPPFDRIVVHISSFSSPIPWACDATDTSEEIFCPQIIMVAVYKEYLNQRF